MSPFETALSAINIKKAQSEVANQGWTLLADPLSAPILKQIKAEIDTMAEAPGTEVNYGGSEHRVWKAHEHSPGIEEFRRFSDAVVSQVDSSPRAAYDILAIRNRVLKSDNSQLTQGRWHLDSFNRQLKVFVFLTDVTQTSGPFEMIPGTQAMSFKMKKALRGHLITPKNLIEGTRSYSSLKEELIGKILSQGYKQKVFDVSAGTMALVDTSCVHRARPCTSGERYALTSYY